MGECWSVQMIYVIKRVGHLAMMNYDHFIEVYVLEEIYHTGAHNKQSHLKADSGIAIC